MRTKRISMWACALTLASVGYGQIDWHANPGGNTIIGGEWFGADDSSTVPLQIRHDANQPIEWYTNAVQRMQLNPTQNSTINGFTVATDGFLGLGRFPVANTAPGKPWTRLHLHLGLRRVSASGPCNIAHKRQGPLRETLARFEGGTSWCDLRCAVL